MVACKNQNQVIIRILLRNRANLSAVAPTGHSVIHFGVMGRNQQFVRYLVKIGAQVDFEDKHTIGEPPLDRLARPPIFYAMNSRNITMIDTLVQWGEHQCGDEVVRTV